MFCNTKLFISKYSKQSLLKIMLSIIAVVVFYCIRTYYAMILSLIGSETLVTIALFGRGVLLYLFGHISVVFQIFFFNVFIRIVISVAILSFVSGVSILYQFAFAKFYCEDKKIKEQKTANTSEFFSLQQSYLFNQRLIN